MKAVREWYGLLWMVATVLTALAPFVSIEWLVWQGMAMRRAIDVVGFVVMVLWPIFIYVGSVLMYLMSRELGKDWWEV